MARPTAPHAEDGDEPGGPWSDGPPDAPGDAPRVPADRGLRPQERDRPGRAARPARSTETAEDPHRPVLLAETVDALAPRPGATVVDGTFGAGGHARAVAERLGREGTLVVVDRDPTALALAERFAADTPCRVVVRPGAFADVLEALAEEGISADGAYFDLGMSSMQVDTAERGFSYVGEGPLDMRMDPTTGPSAAELLAAVEEADLARDLQRLGDERHARRIARAVVAERERAPITTTGRLAEVVAAALPAAVRLRGGGHPAKRTFQALRIRVNGELEQLERALPAAWSLLRPGGRLAVISFHSLEDRPVKRFLTELARGCVCPPGLPVCVCGHEPEARLLPAGGVAPTEAERENNPRSRSARLRAAERLAPAAVGAA